MSELNEDRRNKVTEAFDHFIEKFVIERDSILTEGGFEEVNLDKAIEVFYDKYVDEPIFNLEDKDKKKGKTVFDIKLEKQLESIEHPQEVNLLFAHLQWLWLLAAHDSSPNKKKDNTVESLMINRDEKEKHQKKKDVHENFNNLLKNDIDLYPEGIATHGQYHKTHKYEEIKYLLLLIRLFMALVDINKKKWDKNTTKVAIERISEYIFYTDEKDKSYGSFKDSIQNGFGNLKIK